MNDFSKLNRDEMRKITGGVPPICFTDRSCGVTTNTPDPTPDPDLGNHPLVLLGMCESTGSACYCIRRDANGGVHYGTEWPCTVVE